MQAADEEASPRLLLIAGELGTSVPLAHILTGAGYDVETAHDGQTGLHLALTSSYDVMVITRDLPVVDGIGLIRRVRRQGVTTRALMLTEEGGARAVIEALDAGADDHLRWPFESEELVARLRALLRRRYELARELRIGAAVLDLDTRSVTLADGEQVVLSEREFQLMQVLAARPTTVHTRQELARRVFHDAESASLAPTYVYYLRRKLGRSAVRTVHNLGYQLGYL